MLLLIVDERSRGRVLNKDKLAELDY